MLDRISKWFRQSTCKHVFVGTDIQPRDDKGMVHWPCSKCGRVFRDEYGLAFSKYGKLTGPWIKERNHA